MKVLRWRLIGLIVAILVFGYSRTFADYYTADGMLVQWDSSKGGNNLLVKDQTGKVVWQGEGTRNANDRLVPPASVVGQANQQSLTQKLPPQTPPPQEVANAGFMTLQPSVPVLDANGKVLTYANNYTNDAGLGRSTIAPNPGGPADTWTRDAFGQDSTYSLTYSAGNGGGLSSITVNPTTTSTTNSSTTQKTTTTPTTKVCPPDCLPPTQTVSPNTTPTQTTTTTQTTTPSQSTPTSSSPKPTTPQTSTPTTPTPATPPPPPCDLAVQIEPPATPKATGFEVTLRVTRNGCASTVSAVANLQVGGTETPLLAEFANGAATASTVGYVIPPAGGTQVTITARVDPQGQVAEDNEGNNTASTTVTVSADSPQRPASCPANVALEDCFGSTLTNP